MKRSIIRSGSRTIYALREGDVTATYEAYPMIQYASINLHAKTNVTGCMSKADDAPCEFLDHEAPCYFDGTSLGKVQDSEDAIWAMLERWLP